MNITLLASLAFLAFAATAASAQTDTALCDPTIININGHLVCNFDMALVEASAPEVLQSNFTLNGLGEYRDINMGFLRDGKRVFDISTFGVTFVREGDHVRLKISVRDQRNKKPGQHDDRVIGQLFLQSDSSN